MIDNLNNDKDLEIGKTGIDPVKELNEEESVVLVNLLSGLDDEEKFASMTFDILKKNFGEKCDMRNDKTKGGLSQIFVNLKGDDFKSKLNPRAAEEGKSPQKESPKVLITITKDLKYNIQLNDYDHREEYYFSGCKLNANEFFNELKNIDTFLNTQTIPETSKFEKIDLTAY